MRWAVGIRSFFLSYGVYFNRDRDLVYFKVKHISTLSALD